MNITIPYNLTSLQNVTTAADLMLWANDSVGGILAVMFILAVFFVLLFKLNSYDFAEGLLVSSFICLILSVMFSWLGAINFLWVMVFSVIFVLDAFYVFFVH